MKKSLYTLFLGLMLAVSPLFAQEEAPDTKIKKVTEDVLTIVRQDKDIQSGNTKKAIDLVEARVIPHFNFQRMTALAMGRDWNKASPEQNSLTKQFPALAAEWDDEKNAPLTPQDVTPGSHKLFWCRCPNGHSYRSAVKTRVQGSGCPYCAGKNVLPEETSLAAEYPSIAKEWDAAKNVPLLPTQVISGTRRKVWWRCPKGHSWRAAVYSRTTLGTGCPVCTGRQALAGENDLATLYPDIAAQWDEEKNGALHPSNVTAGSNRRVWW